MKSLRAIGLLIILGSNLAGIYIFFEYQKWDIRHGIELQIRQNFPDSELTAIAITMENIHSIDWKDLGEFEYNGRMYDVVRKKIIHAGYIIYYCISDDKETDLYRNLADLVKKAVQSKKNLKDPVHNLFKLYAKICIPPVEMSFRPYLRNADINRAAHTPYESPFLLISSPPPKLG